MVDNAVCRGLKVQRELDADVFLRCVRDDKHHRYVHMHHQHCNAAYMQTETSTGEFLMVARATRHIQKGEEIFANYNNIGDETCAFSMPNCMCYSCKDKSKNP